MGTVEKSRDDSTEEVFGDDDPASVYCVEYEPGYEPFSTNAAILALVAEIQRLRLTQASRDAP